MSDPAKTTVANGLPADRSNAYSRDDLLRCAEGDLFGPEGARLPLPNMLMTDRISLITNEGGKYGKGQITAELDINPDLWFFQCHFKDDPVMPGCLGLDAMDARMPGSGCHVATGRILPGLDRAKGARTCAWRRQGQIFGPGPA